MQCLVCNRKLTRDPSLSRGIGPKCAKKVRGMAGMTGTGGKGFSVLGDGFWEKFIDEHVAIKKRQIEVIDALEVIPAPPMQTNSKGRLILEKIGNYQVYGTKINNDDDLATMFKDMTNFDKEKIYVACLDANDTLLGTQCVAVGNLDSAVTTPREVLKVPFLLGASSFYMLHNHPSGDPTPSDADKSVTKRITDAGNLMGIPLRGHAVIGEDSYAMINANNPAHHDFGRYNADVAPERVPLYDTQQSRADAYRERFKDPVQVMAYARNNVFADKKGTYIMCLNTKNEVVAVAPYSYNDFTQNTRTLVSQNAAAVILVADNTVDLTIFTESTKSFKDQAETLGVKLLDSMTV